MVQYQTRALLGLYRRLALPIFLLSLSTVGGCTFIYLSLSLNADVPPGNTRLSSFLFGVGLLVYGAWGFYKHSKWIGWFVWVYNYGDKVDGRLKLFRKYRDTKDLTGDLPLPGARDGEDLVFRVQVSSPYLSMPGKKGKEIDVEASVDPDSGNPVAVDSGDYLLWIVKARVKKM